MDTKKIELLEYRFRAKSLEIFLAQEKQIIGETITRLRHIQAELQKVKEQAEKEKFETIVQNLGDGIIVCNPDCKIISINKTAQGYLNLTNYENANLQEIMFNQYKISMSKEELLDVSKPHKKFDLVREETEQFTTLYLEGSLDILKDQRGNITNIIWILRNVTEARQEETLKKIFINLISHKLRTPLTVLRGSIEILGDKTLGALNEKQMKFVTTIQEKTDTLENLIEKLIGFSNLEGQKLETTKEAIELKPYLLNLTHEFSQFARDKKLEFDTENVENITLNINRNHLNWIARNLLENAITFNDKEIIKINISVKKEGGKINLSISDNGPGIPPEEREKIFDKFYQIDKYFTGNIKGAGLGLAIVKHIVSAYEGSIHLESQLGKGSNFVILLPI
ncbi:MAG: ATP-binding protein [Pseudomonadota bacterium]